MSIASVLHATVTSSEGHKSKVWPRQLSRHTGFLHNRKEHTAQLEKRLDGCRKGANRNDCTPRPHACAWSTCRTPTANVEVGRTGREAAAYSSGTTHQQPPHHTGVIRRSAIMWIPGEKLGKASTPVHTRALACGVCRSLPKPPRASRTTTCNYHAHEGLLSKEKRRASRPFYFLPYLWGIPVCAAHTSNRDTRAGSTMNTRPVHRHHHTVPNPSP